MMPFSVSVSKPGLFMKKYRNRSLILPLFSLGEIFGSSNVTPLSKLLAVKRHILFMYISSKPIICVVSYFTDQVRGTREGNFFSRVCDSVLFTETAPTSLPRPIPVCKRNRLYCLLLALFRVSLLITFGGS